MTCERCGKDLQIGEWPFCGGIHQHGFPSMSVQADEIPGGFVQEHFGPTPEVFYSKSAMARRAKELGLEPIVRHVGTAGGDKSPHTTRWI